MPSNQDNPRNTTQPSRDSNLSQEDRERGGQPSSSMPQRDDQSQFAGQPDDARNAAKPRRIELDDADLDTEINATGSQTSTTRPDDPNRRNPVGRPGQQPNRPIEP